MKPTSPNKKTSRVDKRTSGQPASAGPDGVALAPPTYGLESADRAQTEVAPQADPEQFFGAPLQMKAALSAVSSDAGSGPALQQNRTSLPDVLKTGIEALSGMSLDDVRVHTNLPKPAQLNALACAQDTDIHVAPGQERHLPHEAWHVVQQKQGRVKNPSHKYPIQRQVIIDPGPTSEIKAKTLGIADLEIPPLSTAGLSTKQKDWVRNQIAERRKEKASGVTGVWTYTSLDALVAAAKAAVPVGGAAATGVVTVSTAATAGPTVTTPKDKKEDDLEATLYENTGQKYAQREEPHKPDGRQHAEKSLLILLRTRKKNFDNKKPGVTFSKEWKIDINAWPCKDPGHDCHALLSKAAQDLNITITVNITGDRAGYAKSHGKAEGATGTITYAPDEKPAFS
jgi:hypothetical protein